MGIRLTTTLVTAALLVATTGGTTLADTTSAGVDRKIVQEALDEVVSAGAQGVQVRVHADRDHFTARSGVAELDSTRPVPLNGRFRAGSLTKSFAATVVLQLVGEGRVELDAPVDRYLPGLVDAGITVRQLLQHTSGLYDYANSIDFSAQGFEPIRFKHWEPEDLVAIATSKPLDFPSGTRWSYSNTNYVVLALLIEKITGQSFERTAEQRILKPLHLHATSLPGDDPEIRGPHAHAHGLVNGKPTDITRWNPSVFWAVGDIISTTHDLDTFYDALIGGRLLMPGQQAELTRTTVNSPSYGLGLIVRKLPCGTTIVGHTGGVPGFLSYAFTTPDRKKRVQFSATASVTQANPTPAFNKVVNEVFC